MAEIEQNGETVYVVSDEEANELWREFYPKLKRAIAYRVRDVRLPVTDESEIAASAINSFITGVKQGRLPQTQDNNSLWKLLKTIAIRKANDHRKRHKAQKRGGGKNILNQRAGILRDDQQIDPIHASPDHRADPERDEDVSDLFNHLLAQIEDVRVRDVVLLRLQDAPLALIADSLSISTRTVRRMLESIEDQWTAAFLTHHDDQ
ncbi:MAG: ECF-type sigma factor [Planctomycetota bacterium]